MSYKHKRGFTLIELLVVVLIIAILAAIALPQYQKTVAKTSMAHLLTVGRVLHEAQERYYLEHGEYTNNLDLLDVSIDTAGFSYIFDGNVIVLSDKRQPKLRYVWYPRHLYGKDSPNKSYNNQRECRVYDKNNEMLKRICQETTGRSGTDVGTYWSSPFPTKTL